MEEAEANTAPDEGFTLIELLIAIVVVGILTAVAIVGINGLTNTGKTSACNVTRDASQAAEAVHYANTNGGANVTLAVLNTSGLLELTGSTTAAGDVITGSGWTLTRTAGTPDTYACT